MNLVALFPQWRRLRIIHASLRADRLTLVALTTARDIVPLLSSTSVASSISSAAGAPSPSSSMLAADEESRRGLDPLMRHKRAAITQAVALTVLSATVPAETRQPWQTRQEADSLRAMPSSSPVTSA